MALALAAVSAQAEDDKVVVPDSTGFTFTDIKVVKTTPVKDQNKSGTCWSFSGTGFMEDEILRKTGKEVLLSEMFSVRKCYEDKADNYVRRNGKCQLAAGGSGMDVPYVIATYGLVPAEAYTGLQYGEEKHEHSELDPAYSAFLKVIASKPGKRLSTAWKKAANGILDAYLGQVPESFVYEGKTYTPQTFAKAMGLDMDDYVYLTSFTHHPFYQPFVLEMSDNWLNGSYMNLPLDELKAVIDNALENGYSVNWAADVSEPGFKWRKGYAVMPKVKEKKDMEGTELSRWVQLSDKDRQDEAYDIKGPVEEITVTQESRQEMWDRQETTDDHGMIIVGIAKDQEGNKYYKVKNSWDTNQLYGGYIYVSEPYLLAKTVDISVHKDAVPASIAKKMKR